MSTTLNKINLFLQQTTANNVNLYVTPNNVCSIVQKWWQHTRNILSFVWQRDVKNKKEYSLVILQKKSKNQIVAIVNALTGHPQSVLPFLQSCLHHVRIQALQVPCPVVTNRSHCLYWHIRVHVALALEPKHIQLLGTGLLSDTALVQQLRHIMNRVALVSSEVLNRTQLLGGQQELTIVSWNANMNFHKALSIVLCQVNEKPKRGVSAPLVFPDIICFQEINDNVTKKESDTNRLLYFTKNLYMKITTPSSKENFRFILTLSKEKSRLFAVDGAAEIQCVYHGVLAEQTSYGTISNTHLKNLYILVKQPNKSGNSVYISFPKKNPYTTKMLVSEHLTSHRNVEWPTVRTRAQLADFSNQYFEFGSKVDDSTFIDKFLQDKTVLKKSFPQIMDKSREVVKVKHLRPRSQVTGELKLKENLLLRGILCVKVNSFYVCTFHNINTFDKCLLVKKYIEYLLDVFKGAPFLIIGDFNIEIDSINPLFLKEHYLNVAFTEFVTSKNNLTIDYMLYTPAQISVKNLIALSNENNLGEYKLRCKTTNYIPVLRKPNIVKYRIDNIPHVIGEEKVELDGGQKIKIIKRQISEFDLEFCSNDDKDKKKRDFGEFAVESSESDESERVRDHSILFGTLVVS